MELIVTQNADGSVTVAPAADDQAVAAANAALDQQVIQAPDGSVVEPATFPPGTPTSEVIDAITPAGGGPQAPAPGAGDVSTSELGASTEAVLPPPAPDPQLAAGGPAVVTAEPERVGVEIPTPPAPEPPKPPETRLAVGTHVVARQGELEAAGEGARFGVILEAVILPGATEPAYRVGWFDTSGGLIPEAALLTTREWAVVVK